MYGSIASRSSYVTRRITKKVIVPFYSGIVIFHLNTGCGVRAGKFPIVVVWNLIVETKCTNAGDT